MLRSLTIAILMFTGLCSPAQNGRLVFTNYTTAQGLPDNNIQSVLADSRGFLWIATSEGLSRFDGKNFKNFYAGRADTAVQGNFFSNLREYKKGHLVMNNSTRSIAFNTYTGQFYTLPVSRIDNSGLVYTPGGWLLSCAGMIHLVNDSMEITASIPSPGPGNTGYVTGTYLQPGELVLMTGQHCYRYNIRAKKATLIPVNFGTGEAAFNPYLRYYDAAEQMLYFSEYTQGLYRHSLRTGKTERMGSAANGVSFSDGFVYSIIPVSDSTWWLHTDNGLRIWQRRSNQLVQITGGRKAPGGIAGNAVFSSCADAQGNRWLATSNGLSKLNANAMYITSYADASGSSGGLMSIVKGPDASMYVSAYLGQASTIEPQTGQVKPWAHPANTGNWNLFVRGDEVVRTGTGNRLLAYNTRSKTFRQLNFLQPFYPDVELVVMGFVHSSGDEWYCANRGGGFVRRLAGTGTFKTYRKNDGINSFSYTYYSSYAEDGQGDLWFGVNKTGILLHWLKQYDRFEEIDFNSISGTEQQVYSGINAVCCDKVGNVWVAFNGSGLIQYNVSSKKAVRYSIADGLPSDFVTGLRFDGQHRLWITTLKGLSCFIAGENRFVSFRKGDGLPADDFTDYCNYYDTATNQLWLGAHSVLMHFNPDELLAAVRSTFPVYIDEMYLNGRRHDLPAAGTLLLKPGENNLQFHFVGVDLNKGADIEYSYRLTGADGNWIAAGTSQTAAYANLKPGTYSFTARARYKGDNRWNEAGLPIRFTIATPWNRSWWFLLLTALAAAALTWYLIKSYYNRRLEKERAVLEKQKAVEQERTRIATDMHDDFGASLSRIKFLSEKIKITGSRDAELAEELTKISGYSDEMAEKMGEIVWALNQKYDSLGELVAFCRSYASEYLEAHNIALHFEEAVTDRQLKGETRRNLFLVMKESLHNIIRHAGAANVKISFTEVKTVLAIRISDDGCGINMNNIRPFANGLENMKKRIADCGGTLRLYNEGGLVVDIAIPLQS